MVLPWLLPPALLSAPARAHCPHDATWFAAPAPDGTLLTEERGFVVQAGEPARYVSPPFSPGPCAWALSRTTWLVGDELTRGRLWRTEDAGESWTALTAPDTPRRCLQHEGTLLFAGAEGAWESADGASWSQLQEGDLVDLARGDVLYTVTADGELLADGAVLDPGPVVAVAAGADRVVWAPLVGPLRDGEGELDGSPGGVLHLAVRADGTVLATTPEEVWTSGGTGGWALAMEGLDELADGLTGGPDDGVHYADVATLGDGAALASFEGFYQLLGDRWAQFPLATAPLVNVARALPDGRLVLATNGEGVVVGTPGGDDWTQASGSLKWSWIRRLRLPEADDEPWMIGAGNHFFVSWDEGAAWEVVRSDLAVGGDALAVLDAADGGRVWLLAGADEALSAYVSRSTDGLAAWEDVPLSGPCDGGKIAHFAQAQGGWWALCRDGLYRSEDDGASWEAHATLGTTHLIGAPVVTADDRLLLPTADGIWQVVDQGSPSRVALAGDRVSALAWDAEGRLWGAVQGRGIFIGEEEPAWTGWPAWRTVVDVSFTADGGALVANDDGVWLSEDEGATWALVERPMWLDDREARWRWDGFEAVERGDALFGVVRVGEAGAAAWLDTSADAVTLLVDGDGAFTLGDETVVVQGPAEVRAPGRPIELVVTEGTVALDGAVVPADRPEAPAVGRRDCGCGLAEPGPGVAVGGALLLRRRVNRRRAPPPPPARPPREPVEPPGAPACRPG
jgi:hypothetical protein